MLDKGYFILNCVTGSVLYSPRLDGACERRPVVTVHVRAYINEDAGRSQAAGSDTRPLLAQSSLQSGKSALIAGLLFVFMPSCCSAVSHSAASSTAGAPGYLKSMWTSASAAEEHQHWATEEFSWMHAALKAKHTKSRHSTFILKILILIIFFPIQIQIKDAPTETNMKRLYIMIQLVILMSPCELIQSIWSWSSWGYYRDFKSLFKDKTVERAGRRLNHSDTK